LIKENLFIYFFVLDNKTDQQGLLLEYLMFLSHIL